MGWWQKLFGGEALPWLASGRGFPLEVVGEANYQSEIDATIRYAQRLDDGSLIFEASLYPEPTNPHDRNAVRVVHRGRTLGYLSRRDAVKFGKGVGRPCRTTATFVGGGEKENGDPLMVGVSLAAAFPLRLR